MSTLIQLVKIRTYTTNNKSVIIVGLGMNLCIAKSARGRTYKTLNVCPLLTNCCCKIYFTCKNMQFIICWQLFTFYHCIVHYLSSYAFLLPHVMSWVIVHTICMTERPSKHLSGGWWHFARYIFRPFISIISHIPLAIKACDTLHFNSWPIMLSSI